jgi:hypothetical protein
MFAYLVNKRLYKEAIDYIANCEGLIQIENVYPQLDDNSYTNQQQRQKYLITSHFVSKYLEGNSFAQKIVPQVFSRTPSHLILSFLGYPRPQLAVFLVSLATSCQTFTNTISVKICKPPIDPQNTNHLDKSSGCLDQIELGSFSDHENDSESSLAEYERQNAYIFELDEKCECCGQECEFCDNYCCFSGSWCTWTMQ